MGRETGVCDTEISLEEPDAVARFKRAMPINHGVAGIFGVMRLDILKGTPGIASFVGSDRCLLAELALYGRVHYVPDRVFLWRQHQHQSLQFTRHERMKWFDPRSNKVLGSLYVRRFIAAQGAILRSPLSPMDKLRAFAQTLIWMTSNIGLLFRDARFLGGIMLRKASLRRSKA